MINLVGAYKKYKIEYCGLSSHIWNVRRKLDKLLKRKRCQDKCKVRAEAFHKWLTRQAHKVCQNFTSEVKNKIPGLDGGIDPEDPTETRTEIREHPTVGRFNGYSLFTKKSFIERTNSTKWRSREDDADAAAEDLWNTQPIFGYLKNVKNLEPYMAFKETEFHKCYERYCEEKIPWADVSDSDHMDGPELEGGVDGPECCAWAGVSGSSDTGGKSQTVTAERPTWQTEPSGGWYADVNGGNWSSSRHASWHAGAGWSDTDASWSGRENGSKWAGGSSDGWSEGRAQLWVKWVPKKR